MLHLIEQGPLAAPLLPISTYLEHRRAEYYDRLQAVRERGEIDGWFRYFLSAVAEVAGDAVARAEQLLDLREKYRAALRGSRSRAGEVVDLLFANPVLTARRVADTLGMSTQGAVNLLRQLQALGALHAHAPSQGVVGRWYAAEVLAILEP